MVSASGEVGVSREISHWSNELLEKPGGMRSEGPERRSPCQGVALT